MKKIFIACPWSPVGGGMFKVADYLVQSQDLTAESNASLVPLDTRGSGPAFTSPCVLFSALFKVLKGKHTGELEGVHVNMAERLSLFRKGILISFCKLLKVPVILHLHAAQLHHFYRSLPRPLKALTRWFFSNASHCIVLGKVSEAFVRDDLKVPQDKISIVINGVPRSTVARRIYSVDQPFRFLFLGNLSERKGVSDLLRAFAEFKKSYTGSRQVILHLAGGGDITYYQVLANELELGSSVVFEGWCDQAKASGLQASVDALVLPSYDEGLPLVILEALGSGVAVICTPVGEIPVVLTHELNALFVKPGAIPELSAVMQRLISDTALRESLEVNGQNIYEAEFSIEKFFTNIASIHAQHFNTSAKLKQN